MTTNIIAHIYASSPQEVVSQTSYYLFPMLLNFLCKIQKWRVIFFFFELAICFHNVYKILGSICLVPKLLCKIKIFLCLKL